MSTIQKGDQLTTPTSTSNVSKLSMPMSQSSGLQQFHVNHELKQQAETYHAQGYAARKRSDYH